MISDETFQAAFGGKPAYMILTDSDPSRLIKEVQGWIESGYEPCGGLTIHSRRDGEWVEWSQAIWLPSKNAQTIDVEESAREAFNQARAKMRRPPVTAKGLTEALERWYDE